MENILRHWFVIGCAVLGVCAIYTAVLTLPREQALLPILPAYAEGKPQPPLKVLFVGDIMLDRNVAVHARRAGDESLFKGVEDLFNSNDALVGNLEGAMTTNQSIAQADHSILHFTFDPHFADLLARLGFTAVSLANNHALDFGASGYNDTVRYLDTAGISAFGSPFNDSNISTRLTLKEKNLCLIGYHSLYKSEYSAVVQKITSIRFACDYIVVMSHWGEEYHHEPIALQREAGHAFIDAGADVVIGAHPHIVEPLEIYNNRAIFYSLGNFLFDQGFSQEVKRGLTVGIEFGEENTRFTLTPVKTFEEASVATGTVAQAVLADVVTPDLPQEVADSILGQGFFKLPKEN